MKIPPKTEGAMTDSPFLYLSGIISLRYKEVISGDATYMES